MFTRIFKSGYFSQLFFLIIISVIIWIKPFVAGDTIYSPVNAPLYDIIKWLLDDNFSLKIIIGFILLIIQAVILKRVLSSNDLIPRNSSLPSFFYVLLMSSFGNFQGIQPLLFANLFLIIALQIILTIYRNPESYEQVFNVALLISLGSMFYFPVIFFIIFIWMVFLVFSILKWREWVISILGLLTPYILLFGYYFLTDTIEDKIPPYILFFEEIDFILPDFSISNIIYFGILGLFFIYSFIVTLSQSSENSISYRKKIIALIMFLITAILSLSFAKDYFVFHLCLFFIPFSFFFASYMMQIKKFVVSEIFYLIIFCAWLYNFFGFSIL